MEDKKPYLIELCKEFELYLGNGAKETMDAMDEITETVTTKEDLAEALGKVNEKKIA